MLEDCRKRSIILASLSDNERLPVEWDHSSTHHVRWGRCSRCHPMLILEFGFKSVVFIDLGTLFILVLARYDDRAFRCRQLLLHHGLRALYLPLCFGFVLAIISGTSTTLG